MIRRYKDVDVHLNLKEDLTYDFFFIKDGKRVDIPDSTYGSRVRDWIDSYLFLNNKKEQPLLWVSPHIRAMCIGQSIGEIDKMGRVLFQEYAGGHKWGANVCDLIKITENEYKKHKSLSGRAWASFCIDLELKYNISNDRNF